MGLPAAKRGISPCDPTLLPLYRKSRLFNHHIQIVRDVLLEISNGLVARLVACRIFTDLVSPQEIDLLIVLGDVGSLGVVIRLNALIKSQLPLQDGSCDFNSA